MMYLSQLVNKTLYFQDKPFGKILDMAIIENRPAPPVSKIMIKSNRKKVTIPPSAVSIENGNFILKTHNVPFLPFDEKDFYLSENLLDKQVIDIDGRRLVRVNDVLLEENGEIKVTGIDIGFAGIFRRLGIEKLIGIKPKTLPWTLIEAFDYQTGAVKIKLTQNSLNTFHPSELADILEDVGTKERLGIVESLDSQKAAAAIGEADSNTQTSILEQVPESDLKRIVSKMLTAEIADIFYKLNPLRIKEILGQLGLEKASKIEKFSAFPDDVAGGLMNLSCYQVNGNKTVKEILHSLQEESSEPEAIVVINENEKLTGIVYVKDLININSLATLKDIVVERKFVYPNTDFSQILKLFTQYSLHVLPVVDKERRALGIITVDRILARIEEQKEKDDIL